MDKDATPPDWYPYWGKAGPAGTHLLAYHNLDVAACGLVLLRRRPHWRRALERLTGLSRSDLEAQVGIYFALHDLGKFATGFQNLRPDLLHELQGRRSNKGYLTRHDTLGYLLWRQWLRKRLLPTSERRRRIPSHPQLDQWLRVVTGHHGHPPSEEEQVLRDAFDLPHDADAAEGFVRALLELWNRATLPLSPQEPMPMASWWLAGLMVLADWLGSNANWFPPRREHIPFADYWQRALAQAEEAVSAAGLQAPHPNPHFRLVDAFGTPPDDLRATPLQRWAEEVPLSTGPTLFLLEDFTGSGKTEAALTLAQRMMRMGSGTGLYFALPTMATANGIYRRLAAGNPPVYRRLFQGRP